MPPLAQPGAAPAAGGMVATAQDRLDSLARALRATGLDRVRVGMLGNQLVVEYENHRYLHNEADALGVVLGLAAEAAPAGTARVHALKGDWGSDSNSLKCPTRKSLKNQVGRQCQGIFGNRGQSARRGNSVTVLLRACQIL